MRTYRFIMIIEHVADKSKYIKHAIYALNPFHAKEKAEAMLRKVQEKNQNAGNFKLKGVVYEPDENSIA